MSSKQNKILNTTYFEIIKNIKIIQTKFTIVLYYKYINLSTFVVRFKIKKIVVLQFQLLLMSSLRMTIIVQLS